MITRRVHKFEGGAGVFSTKERLQTNLDQKLAPAERIVSTQYIDGYWWVITESFGLGPPNQKGE